MHSSRHIALLVVVLFSTLQLACSSSWKAPVYSSSSALKSEPAPKKQAYIPGSRYYKVQPGDTLYGIAWQTGNDFENLVSWNRLSRPYTIYAGQSLLVKAPAYRASSKPQAHSKPATTVPATKPKKSTAPNKTATTKTASTATEKFPSTLRWRWPVKGKVIDGFSYGDDTKKGVMLAGNLGDPVFAAESGKVVYSGSGLIGYGKLIIIKHNNKYLSAYGYNKEILVTEGAWITKGDKIALIGQSDKGVPALHFEIRKNGTPVNPVKLLPRR